MQRSAFLTVSLLTTAALFSAACSDLGECNDPARGRTLVRVGNKLYYTGQAIITTACATGCHLEGATPAGRLGAPADLNFDLQPLTAGPAITNAAGAVVGVQVDPVQLAKLRHHQQTVYDQREAIWDQVQKGLMPPSKYSAFKNLMSLLVTKITGQSMCADGARLTLLDEDKEKLRTWLACDTPVVETSSAALPYVAATTPIDQGAGAVAYNGSVGFQYPSCSGDMGGGDGGVDGGGDGGTATSFSQVYKDILEPQCKLCHFTGSTINNTLDFQTEDIAYTELLGASGMGGATSCMAMNPNPFVTPGKPEASYLLTKVGGQPGTICGQIMVAPPGIAKEDADKIRAWIMAGAKR